MRRSWRNGIHWSSYMREMEVKISTTKRSEKNRGRRRVKGHQSRTLDDLSNNVTMPLAKSVTKTDSLLSIPFVYKSDK